jgi:MFS family permease
MDASTTSDAMTRSPVDAMRSALRDGINRYKALKDAPETRALLGAAAVSYIGNRFKTIALIALSYKLGDGVIGVGGMLAIQMFPGIVLQPMAGTLVDRFPGKKLMIITQFLMAATALSFILLTAIPSIWLLYALTFILGTIQTVDMPAMEVRLMSVTPREKRGTANAVQMLAITSGEIIGPMIGGLILALAGVTPLFILNALAYVFLASVVAKLPEKIAGAQAESTEEDTAEDTSIAAPKPGYKTLLKRADVLLYTALVASSYTLFYGVIALYIVRAHELGLGDGSVGLFYTIMGIGTFIGSTLAGMGTYMTSRALAIAGIAVSIGAIAIILFGAAPTLLIAIPMLIIVGMIGDIEEVAAITYFQNRLPEGIYARFFSVFMMAAAIGGLTGALVGPLLSERVSTVAAFTALAIPGLFIGVIFAVREGGLRFSIPPFAPQPEPEVAGHGFFTRREPVDLEEMKINGRPVLEPRSHRLI